MNSFYYWNVHELSFVETKLPCDFFPYALFEIRTKEKAQAQTHEACCPSQWLPSSGFLCFTHITVDVVVTVDDNEFILWTWVLTCDVFKRMHCALEPYFGTTGILVWEKHQRAAKRRRLFLILSTDQHSGQSPGCNHFPAFWMYCATSQKISP